MSSHITIHPSSAVQCVKAFNEVDSWITRGCGYSGHKDLSDAFQNLRRSYAEGRVATQWSEEEATVMADLEKILKSAMGMELAYIGEVTWLAVTQGRLPNNDESLRKLQSTFEEEVSKTRSEETWVSLRSGLDRAHGDEFREKLATLIHAVLPEEYQVTWLGQALSDIYAYTAKVGVTKQNPKLRELMEKTTGPIQEAAVKSLAMRAQYLRTVIREAHVTATRSSTSSQTA